MFSCLWLQAQLNALIDFNTILHTGSWSQNLGIIRLLAKSLKPIHNGGNFL